MPIYHELKAIFIHIPKTGGTSIEESLVTDTPHWKTVDEQHWYGNIESNEAHVKYSYELDHSTMRYLKKNCKFYDNAYFSFAFVRNPYARLVSEFHHCKYGYSRFIRKAEFETFSDFVMILQKNFDYILKNEQKNHYLVSHYLPQYKFTHNYKDLLIVDFIGKLENIQEDWNVVCKKLMIENEITHSKKYASPFEYKYEEYYTPELKEIVYQLYEKDFIYFKYEK